jgi:secreted protein with Ig-like and vWFA domain
MPEMILGKIVVLALGLFWKAKAQVDEYNLFAATSKRIQRCTERAAKPRDQRARKH